MTPTLTLRHGTTKWRADQIVLHGPDPLFRESGGADVAEGFSTVSAAWPAQALHMLGPEEYARRKAALFPNEGGPVVLEVIVPGWIVDIVLNDSVGYALAHSGEIRFAPGYGLEELVAEWANLSVTVRMVNP